MPDGNLSPAEYVRRVLDAYCRTPGTIGQVRRSDRLLASQLQQRGVPMQVVENAFVLGASRRLLRAPDAPPLTPVRSLAYFVPVIEEVLELKISASYFQYLFPAILKCGTKLAPKPRSRKCFLTGVNR